MHETLRTQIDAVRTARPIGEAEMTAAVGLIMDGQASEVEIAAWLTALSLRTEAVEELVGAARAMRARASGIVCQTSGLLDTCGTGGDGLATFNISTAAAIVIASCGVPVAKHGNRSFSSKTGSADVLEALGVTVTLSPAQVGACIDQIGLGFCFAPLVHGAMKYAAPVRKQLGFRTIFNLLGPLTNPAGAEYQVLGCSRNETAERMAQALARLGTHRSVVVCGNDELDEVALWGTTSAWLVEHGTARPESWQARDFGLPECAPADLRIDSPAQSAALILAAISPSGQVSGGPATSDHASAFSGTQVTAARHMIAANVAAGLLASGRITNLADGARQALAAMTDGRAGHKLETLIATSRSLSVT